MKDILQALTQFLPTEDDCRRTQLRIEGGDSRKARLFAARQFRVLLLDDLPYAYTELNAHEAIRNLRGKERERMREQSSNAAHLVFAHFELQRLRSIICVLNSIAPNLGPLQKTLNQIQNTLFEVRRIGEDLYRLPARLRARVALSPAVMPLYQRLRSELVSFYDLASQLYGLEPLEKELRR